MAPAKLHSDDVLDVATASNYKDFNVRHYALDLDVNFDSKSIDGTAILDVEVLRPVDCVTLDIHTLEIKKITQLYNGNVLDFDIKPFAAYGSSLNIKHKFEKEDSVKLEIQYTAPSTAPGVCWLEKEQTAGKKHPYMYTQGQAVLNRSFFPCVDTPAVKCIYSATVKVPKGLRAVMSADEWTDGDEPNVFKFNMTKPIPAYLVALAVGDIKSAKIGPRSRVWTEPVMLDEAQAEFVDIIEQYITTGEELFGPYVWGRCDLLVLPPCFPYGGMENPCLTFLTPTLIVGDKSLTHTVMHEIAHSWFGNLVTNANWSDFWLNEGFTMYAQRRICAKIQGMANMCLEATTRRATFRRAMEVSGEDNPLNQLRVVIAPGVDPDDTYNDTPYEKGFCFCSYLCSEVGGFDVFDKFLTAYVDKFKFKSIVSEDFFEFFLDYFPEKRQENLANRKGLEFVETWLNQPGWPPHLPDLSAAESLTSPAELLADHLTSDSTQESVDICKDISDWPTFQVLHFLETLLAKSSLTDVLMEKISKEYPSLVNNTKNKEIQYRWCLIVLKNDYQTDFHKVRSFLESQGKQKFTLPVYQAMMAGSETAQKLALEVYAATKHQIHVSVRHYIDKVLYP